MIGKRLIKFTWYKIIKFTSKNEKKGSTIKSKVLIVVGKSQEFDEPIGTTEFPLLAG